MSESPEKDTPPVEAMADLIDHWWLNADQPTMHHDGIEYVASLALARFLLANGCVVREELAARLEAEIRPLLIRAPSERPPGYDCCGCGTYDDILDHAIRIARGA